MNICYVDLGGFHHECIFIHNREAFIDIDVSITCISIDNGSNLP